VPRSIDSRPNLFLNTARLYDMDVAGMASHDLAFYRRHARKQQGDILELACGTGRVAIPLAQSGYHVWGLDLSPQMLSIFREKAERLSAPERERLTLIQGGMEQFELNRTFPLIIVPFRGFQALTSEDQIAGCLSAIRRHLASSGIAIIDVFEPGDMSTHPQRGERVDWVRELPETGQTVTRTRVGRSVDTQEQVLYSDIVYYISERDGSDRTLVDHLALKYYYRYQMEYRLAAAGFQIIGEYGDYNQRRPGTGPEQIFVVKPAIRGGA
jgi:ubiquinone/menaquinone biosynthesis C-methylase UbiE